MSVVSAVQKGSARGVIVMQLLLSLWKPALNNQGPNFILPATNQILPLLQPLSLQQLIIMGSQLLRLFWVPILQ